MPEFTSFDELQQEAFACFEKPETVQRAYDILTEAFPRYPEHADLLYNWRYCAAALLGQPDLALGIMQEALNAGFWWGEDYLRSDSDLASLQDWPEFNRLVEISEALRQKAQAGAKPFLLTLPLPTDTTQPLPLLIALHGNTMNAQVSVENWESAVNQGWLTALSQSSQVSGPEMYVWNDLEWGAREVKAHFQELTEKHSVDPARVVVSGFSKGGEMAIWLALKEVFPLAGFIVVNPGGPFVQQIGNWLPLLEGCKTLAKLRGFFVVGEKDANAEKIKALHELFVSHGLASELVVAPDIRHDFPVDFDQVLARALEYVVGS